MVDTISVVVVKYKSEKYLADCLASVKAEKPLELIVVDNDKNNIGYGAGCNQGSARAKGKYLLFLNPDTLILKGTILKLANYLTDHPSAGIVGPKLYRDKQKSQLQLSTCRFPDFITAAIVYGKLQKLWPQNPWWKNFTYEKERGGDLPIEVDVVAGAALMVRKDVFKQAGGFNPDYFMYFEENELCQRVKRRGWQVVYQPKAEVIHFGQGSTLPGKATDRLFVESKKKYFLRHYSKTKAYWLNLLTNL